MLLLPWPGVIRLSLALERRPQLSPGCMDLFVYIVVLFLMLLLPLVLPPYCCPCPFPFQHAAMRLQIEQKLPVSVAVVVAAGKCEHFGQHSQVVAGELLAQKVLVMMILNYS